MKITPISGSLPGETILAVHPDPAPQVVGDWRRRLNYYTGRALSGVALEVEQTGRGGHLATLGQAVSAGVLFGLEVRVTETAEPQLVISAGRGVSPEGEDVLIPESVTIDWRQLEVFVTEDAPPSLTEAVRLQRLATRRVEDDRQPVLLLDWLTAQNEGEGGPLAHVGVLTLQPVVHGRIGDLDPDDQCERDPESEAFEDRQWIDGCRIAFHAWQNSWTVPYDAATWRNELAYAVFEAESARRHEQLMPWEPRAVPIALIGFAADNTLEFVDRHAVARAAGNSKSRQMLVQDQGGPLLWQARIHQFAEQIAEQRRDDLSIAEISDSLEFLPPAGIVPREAAPFRPPHVANRRTIRQQFFARFSSNLIIDAAPIPAEELDLAMRASYSQRPYERGAPDEMMLLVPVPQRFFDPRLLVVEQVDPVIIQAITNYVNRRAEWLQRRLQMRGTASEIVRSISGTGVTYPDPDPGALELDESMATGPLQPPEATLQMSVHMDGAQMVSAVTGTGQANVVISFDPENESLELNLRLHGINASGIQQIQLRAAPAGGNGAQVESVAADFQMDASGIPRQTWTVTLPADRRDDLSAGNLYLVLTSSARPNGLVRGPLILNPVDALELGIRRLGESAPNEEGNRTLIGAAAEAKQLQALGVDPFISLLESKVKKGDDIIDLHFAATNTILYKVRQQVLGTEDASRLGTSPALAAIAVKGESAATTRDDIRRFVEELQFKQAPASPQVRSADTSDPRIFGLSGDLPPGGFQANALPSDFLSSGEIPSGRGTVEDAAVGGFDITGIDVTDVGISAGIQAKFIPMTPVFVAEQSVFDQLYLVGKAELNRTGTVGERLRVSESSESKNAAVSTFNDVVTKIIELQSESYLQVDDLIVSGVSRRTGAENNEPVHEKETGRVLRESFTIGQLRNNADLRARVVNDPDPLNPDESSFYSAAVEILEHTIALLRRLEGRVHQYRTAIAMCQRTISQLQELGIQADRRLKEIADELAEARHDVSVARAIRDEEQAKVDLINNERDLILSQHVRFIAYHRPRILIPVESTPTRDLDPGLLEQPLPACQRTAQHVPKELRSMVDLLRDAPVKWFPKIAKLLDKLDQPEAIEKSVVKSNRRAQQHLAAPKTTPFQVYTTTFSQSIGKVYTAQRNSVDRYRAQSARVNYAVIAQQGWKATKEKAKEIVSLGDLLDADHTYSEVIKFTADELGDIAQVAACLYQAVGEVAAAIRLVWAEMISQFDQPVDLSDFSRLPKWGDARIEYPQRVEIQTLNRWLFGRVDQKEADAVGLISDLVRVCILLASHAPVNMIISGRVEQPTPLQPGGIVPVKPSLPNVAIGMQVFMYKANRIVARGVVDDLVLGRVSTRVMQVYESQVVMDKDDLVQFGTAASSAFSSQGGSRFLR